MFYVFNRDMFFWLIVRIIDFFVYMYFMSVFLYFDCRKLVSIVSVLVIDVGINFEGGKEYVN